MCTNCNKGHLQFSDSGTFLCKSTAGATMGSLIRSPRSGNDSLDGAPPFLPLEVNMGRPQTHIDDPMLDDANGEENYSGKGEKHMLSCISSNWRLRKLKNMDGKKLVLGIMGLFFLMIVYEYFFKDPADRLIQPDFADKFLLWVEANPGLGLVAILIVIAVAVVTLVPIGTPLTLGCGYIYRGVYGWKMGIFISTVVSMLGSCLGAVICFLLGRYLMRETVQQWARKYPLFDAINIASKEQGLKIMAMLYLTPVIPLGLVSYMCGTTSMNVYAFAFAKVFALPLYLIYTFMGASAHAFVKRGAQGDESVGSISASEQAKQLEENQTLLVSGLVLSIIMMSLITRHIRKELMKILDAQKKEKTALDGSDPPLKSDEDDVAIELGLHARRRGVKSED